MATYLKYPIKIILSTVLGFPGDSVVKNPPASAEDAGSIPSSDPRRRKWQPTSVFSHGESPWTEEPRKLQSMESKELDVPNI